jgi:hypothetical protein
MNIASTEDIYNPFGLPLGYWQIRTDDDTGIVPRANIVQSAVEALCSKTAQLKLMPFLNPVNGLWKTQKVCRQGQIYFDEFFDKQKVNLKGIKALRFALDIEFGAVLVNDETMTIDFLRPWEVFYDLAEYQFEELSRIYISRQHYPAICLADKFEANKEAEASGPALEQLSRDRKFKGTYGVYYDLLAQEKWEFFNMKFIRKTPLEYSCCPVKMLWFEEPMKGGQSISGMDLVYSLQTKIDAILQKWSDAFEVSPFNMVVLPLGGAQEPEESRMTTQPGVIMRYDPANGGSAGNLVTVVTPRPIDPAYSEAVEMLEQKIYTLIGISQLSAQSKKPAGIESGVAMQTLEDVESERFQDLQDRYKRFLMDIAQGCIDIFPQDAEVLPKKLGRAKIKWSDIKKERDTFSIQFSDASSLSKDPAIKMGQIQQLISMKIISAEMAADLLQFPDLQKAYSVASAAYDDCQRIIERAAETGDTEFYPIIDLQMLFNETAKMLLRLDAVDENKEVLDNLKKLLKEVMAKVQSVQASQAPPPPMPTPAGLQSPPPPTAANGLPIQPGQAPEPQPQGPQPPAQ